MSGLFSSDTKALAETHLLQLNNGWLWKWNFTEFGCPALLGGKQCHSADFIFVLIFFFFIQDDYDKLHLCIQPKLSHSSR